MDSTPLPADHPMLRAWEDYKTTDEFKNNLRFIEFAHHRLGALWGIFTAGWKLRNNFKPPLLVPEAKGPVKEIVAMIEFKGRCIVATPDSVYELIDGKTIILASPEDFARADAAYKAAHATSGVDHGV